MTQQNKSILNTLIKCDKNTLKALREGAGFDYNKPILTREIDGAFTLKKLKTIFNLSNKKVVLLIKVNKCLRYYSKYINYVLLNEYNDNIILDFEEYKGIIHIINSSLYERIGWKKDFEEIRKNAIKTLIIAQDRQYLKSTKKESESQPLYNICNDLQRVKINNIKTFSHLGEKYLDGLELIKINGDDGKIHKVEHSGRIRYFSVNDPLLKDLKNIIDKSGYNLRQHKEELKARAQKLRREREKAQYQKEYINQAKKLTDELTQDIYNINNLIMEKIKKAQSLKELYKIYDNLNGYNILEFKWAINKLDEIKTDLNSFDSFNDFIKKYESIKNDLDKTRKLLKL